MGDEEKTQGRRLEEERAVEGERAVREGERESESRVGVVASPLDCY